jgi:hypothetical protein
VTMAWNSWQEILRITTRTLNSYHSLVLICRNLLIYKYKIIITLTINSDTILLTPTGKLYGMHPVVYSSLKEYDLRQSTQQ